MKCILTTTVLTMSCLPAHSRASAQAIGNAKVLFEFTVGHRVLPPGDSSIKKVASGVIETENLEKCTSLYVSTFTTEYVCRKPNTLVFSKYGDQCLLREVKGGNGEYNLDLHPSKLEEVQSQVAARANQQSVRSHGDRTEVVSEPPLRPGD